MAVPVVPVVPVPISSEAEAEVVKAALVGWVRPVSVAPQAATAVMAAQAVLAVSPDF